ncbi:MAG: endospore germination permease [Tepidanaerobacteraceae bacterium]|nr:endospore germination permease [Tepidanaerobacteraceae bacterium]
MLEKGRISSLHLTATIAVFIIGTSVLLPPARDAKQSEWLAVSAGMIMGLLYNAMYVMLAVQFPGRIPIEYNDIIFGRYLGKAISALQLWFAFHLGSLVLRNISEFFVSIMPETPIIAFAVLMMLVCASAARNGIETIADCGPLIMLICFLTLFFDISLGMKDIKVSNYLPLLNMSLNKFFRESYGAASFPFAETVIFLMIFPFVKKREELMTSTLKGVFLGGAFLILEIIRNIGVLGQIEDIYTYPTFEAVRLIDVANIVTRLEIAISGVFILTAFMKLSALFYVTVLGSAHLLKMRSYLPLVLPVGSMMILLSLINFDNVVENIEFAARIYPVYSFPFELLIPMISLLVAKFRRLSINKLSSE